MLKLKKIFTPVLVRAKLYILGRVVGLCRCGKKRCEKSVFSEMDTFIGTVAGETYKVNHKLNCDVGYLICLLLCNHCRKEMLWRNY